MFTGLIFAYRIKSCTVHNIGCLLYQLHTSIIRLTLSMESTHKASLSGGTENDGHENAGHEIDGLIYRAFVGHEIAGHEIVGQKSSFNGDYVTMKCAASGCYFLKHKHSNLFTIYLEKA